MDTVTDTTNTENMKKLLTRFLRFLQKKIETKETTVPQECSDDFKRQFDENAVIAPDCKKCEHFMRGARICALNGSCDFNERKKYAD